MHTWFHVQLDLKILDGLYSCSRRGIRKCYLLSVTDAFSPPNNKNPWIVLHSINVRKRFFPNFQVRELNIYQLNKFSQSASNLSAKQASQQYKRNDTRPNSPVSSFHRTLSFTNGFWSGSKYI